MCFLLYFFNPTCKSISNNLISQDTKVFEEFLERVVLGVKTQLSLLIQSLPFKGPVFLKRSLISVLCARCHPPCVISSHG